MADDRTTAETAGSAVPKARAAEPAQAADQPGPPRKRAAKANKAAKSTERAKPRKATKATGTSKAAKAPKKTTAATQATKPPDPPAAAAPRPAEQAPPAAAAPGPAAPGAWTDAAWEAVRQPDQPPQRLAELVVAELGPRAAAWAGWLRETYPAAPAHGMVRLAAQQAGRAGWVMALAEAGGPVGAALCVPAAAWVRATVVLRIAAAYGHDPGDPRRAGELLELTGLPASGRPPAGGPFTALPGRSALARFAITRLGLRRTPAAAVVRVLTAAADRGDGLERLAHRAARFYRRTPLPTASG